MRHALIACRDVDERRPRPPGPGGPPSPEWLTPRWRSRAPAGRRGARAARRAPDARRDRRRALGARRARRARRGRPQRPGGAARRARQAAHGEDPAAARHPASAHDARPRWKSGAGDGAPGRGQAPLRELGARGPSLRRRPLARGVLEQVADSAWYRRHGAIVQELVPPQGYDLRIVVAAGCVVGRRVPDRGRGRVAHQRRARRRPPSRVASRRARRPRSRSRLRLRPAPRSSASTSSPTAGRLDRRRAERRRRVHARVRPWGDVFEETARLLAREAERRLLDAVSAALGRRLRPDQPAWPLLHSCARGGVAQLVRAAES